MAENGKQATWGGRFSEKPSELMQRFGESVSFDARLALFDIAGSRAHAKMLGHTGIISPAERDEILKGLDFVESDIREGRLKWDPALEDVHMNIEQALRRLCPAAAKLHTARSRNDQVATDMRLWFKWATRELQLSVRHGIGALIDLAERTTTCYLPGYTHLQRAQPVSMAHHLLAYCEMLGRDLDRLKAVEMSANVSPLGSGAIAGTTLPIDRHFSANELGFLDAEGNPRLTQNSMDAVSDRDTFIDFTSACATIGVHLSRLSEDIILWNSAEFGYLTLSDAFTTGSSLMPQKKNPDSFELIRGKCARLQGNLQTLLTLCKGLPLTYNRDLQEDKPPVFDSFDQTQLCLNVMVGSLQGAKAQPKRCEAAVSDPALLATDLVDYLVLRGVAFRDAHHIIGKMVAKAESANCDLNQLSDADVMAICDKFEPDWRQCFNVEAALRAREQVGMPGPKQVANQIQRWRDFLTT